MLQGTPEKIDIDEVVSEIKAISGIKDVHDCHMWTLEGEQIIFSAHLVVDSKKSLPDLSLIKDQVREKLKLHEIGHATLEFETEDEECKLEDC